LRFPVLAAGPADTILVNGKDRHGPTAASRSLKASRSRGQRIVAVGTTAKILKLKGADTKVIDLVNKTVIPGLIDNHAHFHPRAPSTTRCAWTASPRASGALAMLAERVRRRESPAGGS